MNTVQRKATTPVEYVVFISRESGAAQAAVRLDSAGTPPLRHDAYAPTTPALHISLHEGGNAMAAGSRAGCVREGFSQP
ncbi:hypothetical protein VTN02DRAFT_2489 [Thermoascus thermophilus]